MDKLINWTKIEEVSIYDQLKQRLYERKELDKKYIMEDYIEEEYEEEFEKLEEEHNIYNEKLELVGDLSKYDDINQQSYLKTIAAIDKREDLSNSQKLKIMVSYGSLFATYNKIDDLDDSEKIMIAASIYSVPLEVQDNYVMILADQQIRKSIMSKTEDFMEQTDLAFEIMDMQDEYDIDFINEGSYQFLVNNAINIIDNFSKKR
ncbi:MAG: hypothetical protein PHQ64_02530 [Bacilli bacterium]|nr:hypothetical protein [Bacilli bacterium]